jgi:hypothetical protein
MWLPTAVHARNPEQETARRPPYGTAGVDWIDQRVPFQTSTSGTKPPATFWLPTAKQNVGQGHETPFRCPYPGLGRLGVGMTSQLVPSHRSASGYPSAEPTAMHESADAQSTPSSSLAFCPTLGVGGTLHPADAAEGASSSAAVASPTKRTDGRLMASTSRTPLR